MTEPIHPCSGQECSAVTTGKPCPRCGLYWCSVHAPRGGLAPRHMDGTPCVSPLQRLAETFTAEQVGDGYLLFMDEIVRSCSTIARQPVGAMLALVDHAETVGPIIDPTRYLKGGGDSLAKQRRLLRAVLTLQAIVWNME